MEARGEQRAIPKKCITRNFVDVVVVVGVGVLRWIFGEFNEPQNHAISMIAK